MLRRKVLGILSASAGLPAQSRQSGEVMLKFVGTLIAVEDVARSRRFYEELLGQRVKHDFGRDVAYEGGFSIHLKSHFQELLGGAARTVVTKAHNGELYFESDRPEFYAQRLEGASVTFVHGLQEQPWGQRVIRFYDPDGHIIEIGEPMATAIRRMQAQGMTIEAIVKRTRLPRVDVDGVLGATGRPVR